MKNRLVVINSIAEPIKPAPGFEKKHLSTHKLDIMGLCGFGCVYCSSNAGNYLRINRERFADATEAQLGERAYPAADPSLAFVWRDVIPRLRAQIANKPATWGAGRTLVFSMLTDGFSPVVVADGTTRAALDLVMQRTSFRVRVLTKSAVVGSARWRGYFRSHPGRFVVGLSTGSLDDAWARRVEAGTSSPSARLRALRRLQDDGVPTFGMLCPVFPDAAHGDALERLLDAVRPEAAEHVWAEPYNDRLNWRAVRDGYDADSAGYAWFTRVYERGDRAAWSAYATELYARLRDRARRDGWLHKLRYLLYEGDIVEGDAREFRGLDGVLLQSKPGDDGLSQNPHVAALQGPARTTGSEAR